MEDRVNWRMENETLAWVLRQERAAQTPKTDRPILELQPTRDEIVRSLLTEIASHDGPFGAASLPESIA